MRIFEWCLHGRKNIGYTNTGYALIDNHDSEHHDADDELGSDHDEESDDFTTVETALWDELERHLCFGHESYVRDPCVNRRSKVEDVRRLMSWNC